MVIKGFRFGMLLQVAVGPICIYIFQISTSDGILMGVTGVMGVVLVDTIYILAAILGIGVILNKYDKAKIYMKFIGGLVLVLFGVSIVISLFGINLIPKLSIFTNHGSSSVFIKVLLLTLSNPLTILFWAGVFSTKIVDESMNRRDMLKFGMGAVLSTLTFLSLIAVLGYTINIFVNDSVMFLVNFLVGWVLVFFGIKQVIPISMYSKIKM